MIGKIFINKQFYKLNRIFLIIIFLILTGSTPLEDNNHFMSGERLKFVIYYGPINGGYVDSELRITEFAGNKVYHSRLLGKTIGLVDKLYKVRDEYQSYFDTLTILPYKSIRDISEGRYKKYDHVYYDHANLKVKNHLNEVFDVPEDIRDMVSVFYYVRNIDFSSLEIGHIIKIVTFFDNELFPFDIRYKGIETIKTKMGSYRCIKLVPFVEPGRIFEKEDDMTIYLSDDTNRVPIRVEFILKVGSIKCDLIEYSGLKN